MNLDKETESKIMEAMCNIEEAIHLLNDCNYLSFNYGQAMKLRDDLIHAYTEQRVREIHEWLACSE